MPKTQPPTDMDVDLTATTKLPLSELQQIDRWASANFSDRSKLLRAIIRKVLASIKDQGGFNQSLGDVVQRITLRPA